MASNPSESDRARTLWSEIWNRSGCECGALNWLYHGREDDVSCYSPDGYRCWACKRLLWVDACLLEDVQEGGGSLLDLDIEEARKDP